MRFGVQLPETEYEATWREMEDMARVAEEVGLDSLWVGDHLLYDEGGATLVTSVRLTSRGYRSNRDPRPN